MKISVTAGCGAPVLIGNGVCETHEDHVDFDGFTIRWHVENAPNGKRMWRNGPSIRPNICRRA